RGKALEGANVLIGRYIREDNIWRPAAAGRQYLAVRAIGQQVNWPIASFAATPNFLTRVEVPEVNHSGESPVSGGHRLAIRADLEHEGSGGAVGLHERSSGGLLLLLGVELCGHAQGQISDQHGTRLHSHRRPFSGEGIFRTAEFSDVTGTL